MSAFRSRPNWLDEEPVLQFILNDLVDQLDKHSKPLFKVTPKTTPELFDSIDDDPQYLWDLMRRLDKEYHLISVRRQRTRAGKDSFDHAHIVFNPEKETLLRSWLNRPAFDPFSQNWQRSLDKYRHHFEDEGQALESPIRVEGKTANEVVAAFANIQQQLGTPQTLRNLSAKCFWGDSKFLDSHSKLLYALFPRASQTILPRPIMMNISLPEDIHEIIFVENQDSFLMLKQLAVKDQRFIKTAFVFSSGFKATSSTIRKPGQVMFSVVSGDSNTSLNDFENWWYNQGGENIRCYFWGDMDYAGIAILKSLRKSFPDMTAWKLGFDQMLAYHDNGHGHKIRDSKKMQQLDPGTCGCDYADDIVLPAIRNSQRFLDQEIIASKDLTYF